jgi:hypothetical protein
MTILALARMKIDVQVADKIAALVLGVPNAKELHIWMP